MNNTKFKRFSDDYKYKYENCILFLGRLTQNLLKLWEILKERI